MKLFWRKEYRQTVALVPPEARLLYQALSWLQYLLHVRGAQALVQQAFLHLAKQIPKANWVLFSFSPSPMRRHKQRDAPTRISG
jgi:hypothetical protein